MKITFLGGAREVTGSRYLVESGDVKVLVDCGLFQGDASLTQHNWDPFPVDPKSIDALVLTHAHIDHTGYIPLLVKNGFKGKIYCSQGTYALCKLMLVDSGSVQESNARHRQEQEGAQGTLIEPLYTIEDAQTALTFFEPIAYDVVVKIGTSLEVVLISSHHILGSAFVVVSDGVQKLTFSGDLGRPNQLIMQDPPYIADTDYLVLESTYGDRAHEKGDPLEMLGEVVSKTAHRGGLIILPAFAVERVQLILYCLSVLKQKKVIPDIPIFLDSPLAIGVTELFYSFGDEHTLSAAQCKQAFGNVIFTRTVEESKRLNTLTGPAIIIAGSGMADGGRVVHHLRHTISDAKNAIVFVGYQAHGTTGAFLVGGPKRVKIQDFWYEVRATVTNINVFSAHADYNEILAWLGHFQKAPKKVFLTHGQEECALSLQKKIEDRFGWSVVVPQYLESYTLE